MVNEMAISDQSEHALDIDFSMKYVLLRCPLDEWEFDFDVKNRKGSLCNKNCSFITDTENWEGYCWLCKRSFQ